MKKFTSSIKMLTLACGLSSGIALALTDSEQQRCYLDEIESKLQSNVVFSTEFAKDFLSTQNNESYRTHVERFNSKFRQFRSEVVDSLRAEKQRAAGAGSYETAIGLLYDIALTLDKPAEAIYNTFQKHKNPNAVTLGMALKESEKYTKDEFLAPLQSKLKALQNILNTMYQSLAHKIGIIINSLEQRKRNKLNPAEAFKALSHRIKCTN